MSVPSCQCWQTLGAGQSPRVNAIGVADQCVDVIHGRLRHIGASPCPAKPHRRVPFSIIAGPRPILHRAGVVYPLPEIMLLVLSATLSGMEDSSRSAFGARNGWISCAACCPEALGAVRQLSGAALIFGNSDRTQPPFLLQTSGSSTMLIPIWANSRRTSTVAQSPTASGSSTRWSRPMPRRSTRARARNIPRSSSP